MIPLNESRQNRFTPLLQQYTRGGLCMDIKGSGEIRFVNREVFSVIET
jgi:hypothetical protein